MRTLILSEDYGITLLLLSDCEDSELEKILDTIIQNDEDGIGKSVEEVCSELFPNCFLKEIDNSDNTREITEITVKNLYSNSYLSFNVVAI